jgi:osmoprotectant transport system ATP-binding protein
VNAEHLRRTDDGRPLAEIGMPAEALVEPHATLSDTLNEMLTARYSCAIVVDSSRAYQGIVDIDTINEAVRGMRDAEHARLRGQLSEDGGVTR